MDEVVERPHMEFRAFVNQGKLNALSQYFCFVMNPELIASKQKIEDDIRGFFDDIVKKRIAHTASVPPILLGEYIPLVLFFHSLGMSSTSISRGMENPSLLS